MPYASREQQLEYWRQRYQQKRVAILAAEKEKYHKDPSTKIARSQRWRAENSEKANATQRRYYRANQSTLRAKACEWYAANRAQAAVSSAKWATANREKTRLIKKAWTERNKDLVRAKTAKRRAMKRRAIPKWADQGRINAVYQKAELLAETTGVRYHVDHIVPLLGRTVCGLHVHYNLQILTSVENLKKSNKHIPSVIEFVL